MISVLFSIFYILVLTVALVEILKSAQSGVRKVLWAFLVIAVPVVGIVLYYLLGHSSQA